MTILQTPWDHRARHAARSAHRVHRWRPSIHCRACNSNLLDRSQQLPAPAGRPPARSSHREGPSREGHAGHEGHAGEEAHGEGGHRGRLHVGRQAVALSGVRRARRALRAQGRLLLQDKVRAELAEHLGDVPRGDGPHVLLRAVDGAHVRRVGEPHDRVHLWVLLGPRVADVQTLEHDRAVAVHLLVAEGRGVVHVLALVLEGLGRGHPGTVQAVGLHPRRIEGLVGPRGVVNVRRGVEVHLVEEPFELRGLPRAVRGAHDRPVVQVPGHGGGEGPGDPAEGAAHLREDGPVDPGQGL
mmetsp:Transcript_5236/g.17619  ORF Transcript_5236/g.17619 Transcript_5236/m.17619 type:complete len:298 (-) Transcript_5236:840-1733(-)